MLQSQGGLHCVGSTILMRLVGLEGPVLVKAELKGATLDLAEVEMPSGLSDISETEELLLVSEYKQWVVLVTDTKLKLLSSDL